MIDVHTHVDPPSDVVYSPVASLVRWYKALMHKLNTYRFDEPSSQFLQTSIPRLKQAIKLYKRFHLGLFYMFGVYYHISKRTAGIQYVPLPSLQV